MYAKGSVEIVGNVNRLVKDCCQDGQRKQLREASGMKWIDYVRMVKNTGLDKSISNVSRKQN